MPHCATEFAFSAIPLCVDEVEDRGMREGWQAEGVSTRSVDTELRLSEGNPILCPVSVNAPTINPKRI